MSDQGVCDCAKPSTRALFFGHHPGVLADVLVWYCPDCQGVVGMTTRFAHPQLTADGLNATVEES